MQEVNGKIWIENVEREVKDASQLDPNIYKIPMWLMQHGGNIEIGPGMPPEKRDHDMEPMHGEKIDYGNGIYCTNLTVDQIVQLLKEKDVEERALEAQQKASEDLDMDVEPTMEELGLDLENKVDSIVASIYRKSRNYRLGRSHLLMGIPIGDALENLVASYESDIVPKINGLSDEEKKELLEKLQGVLDNPIVNIERGFFTKSIESINASLNLPQEGSKPIKK